MLKNLKNPFGVFVFFLVILSKAYAGIPFTSYENSAIWANPSPCTWDVKENWYPYSYPHVYPSLRGRDPIPTFSHLNPISSGTITAENRITIAGLILETAQGVDLAFDFSSKGLIFDSGTSQYPFIQVGYSQNHKFSGTFFVNSPTLEISVKPKSTLTISNSTIFDDSEYGGGGFVQKSGRGTLLFEGHNPSISLLSIEEGTVQMGKNPTDFTHSPFPVDVCASASLNGFGTFSVGKLLNAGRVIPGGLDFSNRDEVGTLTIIGKYNYLSSFEQEDNGILIIKAFSADKADKLVVKKGAILLSGTLILEAPDGTFQPGDEIVIISNEDGSGITGAFDTFIQNVPSDVEASIIYNPFDVTIVFF